MKKADLFGGGLNESIYSDIYNRYIDKHISDYIEDLYYLFSTMLLQTLTLHSV